MVWLLHFGGAVSAACRFNGDGGEAIGALFGRGWSRRRGFGLFSHAVELLDEQENCEGDNDKIDDVVEKETDIERGGSSFLGFRQTVIRGSGKIDKEIRKVDFSEQ